jgi:hypothetical protein
MLFDNHEFFAGEASRRVTEFRAEAEKDALIKLAKSAHTDKQGFQTFESHKQKRLSQLKVLQSVRSGQLSIEDGLRHLSELDRSYQV